MPEVPPEQRDPESQQLPDSPREDVPRGTTPPDRQDEAAPAARPGPFDTPLAPRDTAAPRSGPFDRPPEREPARPPASPQAQPPKQMPVQLSQPPGEPAPPPQPLLSTTGVPHYTPPASMPELPMGPAAGGGYAEAAAIAAPRRSILRPVGRGLREIAETIILALLIFLLVRAVVQNFQVEGRSMEPTFENQWYVLVNKALYWEINMETLSKFVPFVDPGDDPTRHVFRGPKRGDVVVFRSPTQPRSAPERDFIKRIIGLPGETVEVRQCTVFVDGQPLDEPYIAEAPIYTYGPEVVPPDHYFVLGDNRNNSSDSHSWGMLPKENLIGQAWLIYWPFSAFGLVDNTSVTPGGDVPSATGPPSGKPQPACS